ncbi:adenylate kinase, conjectural [Pyrobaculum islandicum DSM 4184]|uniref:Adenylate kinase, conjectural n=1 Tax=Pyrobaculum islandicum (strain DSM 4184 / JCM 9189 / GEO3) TaxID=384616 RepID=A1RV27_PYRIL|nr:AAA family ATPase [Pyrobaculum islandicum]ABL88809.1 adenylate kinase, conjectural [Pyrobaculum islandicum DSM 4184]
MAKVIAVAGLPGSGKTTVAKIIERYGYTYYSLGDIVREEAHNMGLPPDKVSVILRLESGRRAIVSRLLKNVKPREKIVIDGIRSLEEVEAIEETMGLVVLIYVVASRKVRYQRLASRGRSDDPSTYSQFLMRDIRELWFGLADLLTRADYILVNERKTVEEIEKEIITLL